MAVVPFDVSKYPPAPIARRVALFVPLPIIRSPVVVTGDKALNAELADVCPVPPAVIGRVPVVRALVDVAYTAPPEVNELRFVPPLAVGRMPETPVVNGNAVALLRLTADGVPRFGVVSTGFVLRTLSPVPVDVVTPVPP